MNDIEKTVFAMDLAFNLVQRDEKILAISLVRKLFNCGLVDAKQFVDYVEFLYDLGN